MLTNEEREEILNQIKIYTHPKSGCLDALLAIQRFRGWVSDEVVNDIATELNMTPAEVDSVATFYTRIYRKPVGRNVILICDGVSCMIKGSESLYKHISDKLGIVYGETTSDNRYTILPITCLGDCNFSPAFMINDDLYNLLSIDKIDEILEKYS